MLFKKPTSKAFSPPQESSKSAVTRIDKITSFGVSFFNYHNMRWGYPKPQKQTSPTACFIERDKSMYHELYTNISNSVGLLTVFLDDEKISQGSCFCIDKVGNILTAAHVVTGRFPIDQEDLKDPKLSYLVKFPDIPLLEYMVNFCAITIEVEGFLKPVQVDIAFLSPKQVYQVEYPMIRTSVIPPRLGEEVFIAGYPDELKTPFLIERIVDKKNKGVPEFLEAMRTGYTADMTGPLIKRAVIGNHRTIQVSNSSLNIELSCGVFYLDNGMHSGASGGPMVNKSGDAVGLITQRAITSASQSDVPSLSVPSGSTVVISLQALAALESLQQN